MGYFLPSSPEAAVPGKSHASPKTHTPLPRLQERGHRSYSAGIGRWISRDPLEERGGSLLYGFVGNDSIRKFDPLGLCPEVGLHWSDDMLWVLPGKDDCKANCGTSDSGAVVPACAQLDMSDVKFSCCCKKKKWYLSMHWNVHCNVYMAEEKKPGDLYYPSLEKARNHEFCHCQDMKKILTDFFNQYGNVQQAGWLSSAACVATAKSLSELMGAKFKYYHDHQHDDPKYQEIGGKRGECFAQANPWPPGY